MTTRKEQKDQNFKQKRAKGEPAFQRPTPEELKILNSQINDKKQNIVQALKTHYQLVFNTKQLRLQINRLDKAIEDGVVIKDDFGLQREEEDLRLEIAKYDVQLKFNLSALQKNLDDFKEHWDFDESKVEFYWNKWFVKQDTLEL